MRGSYFRLGTTRLYVHDGYDRTNEKLDFHITENLTSLSAFGSILKMFGRNRCRLMRGSYFRLGTTRLYVHDGYDRTNEKLDSHITENLTSLSAFGSISKIFGGNRCRLM